MASSRSVALHDTTQPSEHSFPPPADLYIWRLLFLVVTRERGARSFHFSAVFGWYLGNGLTVFGSVAGVGVKPPSYGEGCWAFRILFVSRCFLF